MKGLMKGRVKGRTSKMGQMEKGGMLRGLTIAVLLLLGGAARADDFPRPAVLEPAVQFWTRVYTEVSTDQGYIHDAENLGVVYETLDLPEPASHATRQRAIRLARQRVATALTALGKGKRSGLSAIEAQVLAAWPKGTSNATLLRAANDVRFQLGQSDRFREGLVRSGQWKPYIRQVLADQGLPPELDVLPHVESSFNPRAWSRVAAAGMWQFMPATAREYMRVDHVVDQRMDPFTATEAAARLLKRNYAVTGTWPLALTSYNHGTGGVMRAARQVGSKDIGAIVRNYRGRAFGFASRNFYASFLAALEVDRNAGRHFGDLAIDTPTDYDVVPLSDYLPVRALVESMAINLEDIRRHNPALRDPVWSGDKHIPRGYALRIPRATLQRPLAEYIAAIPPGQRYGRQQPDLTHTIAPGESLWVIARRYDTSVRQLKSLNGLRGNTIRAGKTLVLPGSVAPEAAPKVYVIREGDSLWSIAQRFNISWKQLMALNGISEQQYLQPGQQLKIAVSGGGQS